MMSDYNAPLVCNRCDRELDEAKAVWLELDMLTGLYHAEGNFPEDGESQGHFEFGAACARKELAETRAELAEGGA